MQVLLLVKQLLESVRKNDVGVVQTAVFFIELEILLFLGVLEIVLLTTVASFIVHGLVGRIFIPVRLEHVVGLSEGCRSSGALVLMLVYLVTDIKLVKMRAYVS